MFLLAGLVGLFVSGMMVAMPFPDESSEADDATDADAEETSEEASGGSLLDMLGNGETTSPAATLQDVGADTDAISALPAIPIGDPDEIVPDAPPRDQIAGDHLTDGMAGSSAGPIHMEGDAMLGNGSADDMTGGGGNDLILGNGGDDRIDGGSGRDGLHGGDGNDVLSGGSGSDQLHGDGGDDTLHGDTGDDLLSGGDGDDLIDGGDGNDRLFGGEGRDTLAGGAGDDLLDGSVLDNDTGLDRDTGDRLLGGEGNDTLAGSNGDTLVGGPGEDLYLFRAASVAQFGTGGALDDAPMIEDFDPVEDAIEIMFEGDGIPVLRIVPNGTETHIEVDDVIVARLAGTPDLSLDHIQLVQIG